MDEENKIGYYAIIPANVRYDKELTEKAKLLYGEITCLSNKEGYCFATNNYFAKLYGCTTRAIQNAISKLQERGYVKVVIEENYQRKIFLSSSIGYEKNFAGGYEKNFTNNNINNNKIDRLFTYIIKRKGKIPDEFSKIDLMEFFSLLDKYEMLYTKENIEYISPENIEKIKYISYTIALIVKNKLQHLTYKVSRDKLIQLYDECKKNEIEYSGTKNEIINFENYYYKSVVNELTKGKTPSFFVPKIDKTNDEYEDFEK